MKIPGSQDGLALISVLWVIAALTVIVGSELARVRTDLQLTRTHVHLAKARAYGEAGIYWAIHAILQPRDSARPGTPDGPRRLTWDDATVALAIRNEAGKIDVNTADAALIENALMLAGVETDQARSLSTARQGGARKRFHSVEEFVGTPGIANEVRGRLMPGLTVYGGHAGINPVSATRDVLLAVPDMSESRVDNYLKRRADNPFHTPDPGAGNGYFTDRLSAVYTITARTTMDQLSTTIEAVIRMSSLPDRPYTILRWRSSVDFDQS